MSEWNANRARVRMAQNLSAIDRLHARMSDEATEKFADREFPGGEPMNLVGPAARLSEWERLFEQAEENGTDTRYGSDQEAERHTLLVVGDWEDRVRREREQWTDLRTTVERATAYLRGNLDWIIEHFDGAPAMDSELSNCVSMMENVLKDGVRHDSSAAACFKDLAAPDAEKPDICGGRLVRRTLDRRDCPHVERAIVMAKGVADPVTVLRQTLMAFPEDAAAHAKCDQGGRDDVYVCQSCRGYYTEAEYWLAVKHHYERQAG